MADKSGIELVERMFGKRLAQVGKGDMVAMIHAQFEAINTLMGELYRVDPGNSLLVMMKPKIDKIEPPISGV